MTTQQILTASLPGWPPNRTATRDLSDDFSRMVLGIADLGEPISYLLSTITPVSFKVFNWEAAESRADWEESHGRFVEFNDVKDLLSNLHS